MEPAPRPEGAGGQGADAPASERKGHKKNRMANAAARHTTAGNKSWGNTQRGGRVGSERRAVSALHVQQFKVCGGRVCQTVPNRTCAP